MWRVSSSASSKAFESAKHNDYRYPLRPGQAVVKLGLGSRSSDVHGGQSSHAPTRFRRGYSGQGPHETCEGRCKGRRRRDC